MWSSKEIVIHMPTSPSRSVGDIFPPFQVIDETLDVKEMIFNAERVGGLEEEPVCILLQNLMAGLRSALAVSSPALSVQGEYGAAPAILSYQGPSSPIFLYFQIRKISIPMKGKEGLP